jgi:hypothetical protein
MVALELDAYRFLRPEPLWASARAFGSPLRPFTSSKERDGGYYLNRE